MEAAKTLVDKLREYIDKIHTYIKDLVTRIQGTLGLATKEWKKEVHRAEAAEIESVAAKSALAATVLQQETSGTSSGKGNKEKGKSVGFTTTPGFTPKRTRSSPGDERLAASHEQKRANVRPSDEATSGENSDIPWRMVQSRKDRRKMDSTRKQKPIRKQVKGEAVVVKVSDGTYAKVLRAMGSDPQLKEFGVDVQKIRRTQAVNMIIELKKDSLNRSSAYKELT